MGFKVPLMATVSASAATDIYLPLMNCQATTGFTDEGSANTPFFEPGVLTNLYVSVWTNSAGSSSTVRLRKNSANGNLTLTFGAGLTGRFFDSTNSDTISNGDLACTFVDRGGTCQIGLCGAYYETNSGIIVNKVGASGSANAATGTAYQGFIGGLDSVADNTAAGTPYISVAGTAKNFHAYSNANTRTNTTTLNIRINGANGNNSVTFPASTTGLQITSSSNSDAISVGDNVNFRRVTSTGSGTFTTRHIGFEIHYPSNQMNLFSADLAGISFSATSPRYASLIGSFAANGGDTAPTVRLLGPAVASDFYMRVSANAATASATFFVRDTGVNTSLGVTVPSAGTGTFSDTTNTVTLEALDYLNVIYSKPTGTGGTTVTWFSTKISFTSTFKPYAFWF